MATRTSSILARVPFMARLSNGQGECVAVNPAWTDYTGRSAMGEAGRGWLAGVHPDDAVGYAQALRAACAAHGSAQIDLRLRRHDGEYRWLRESVAPVPGADADWFVCACVDIHDVKEHARALHERSERDALLAREQAARAQVQAAAAARDRFLSIVSHELRSPLNGIQSWTHVLEHHLQSEDGMILRALAGIQTGVAQQVRLIDDLLDATRVMSGKLQLAKQPLVLRPLIEAVLEQSRPNAAAKNVALKCELALERQEIYADPDRVRQVIGNLVSNAIKFTPQGGQVSVSAVAGEASVDIAVSDTGRGINAQFIPFVFDPFRQGDERVDRRGQDGLGLGLALVKRLVEMHGGRVSAESGGENQGATFRVSLPLHKVSVATNPDLAEAGAIETVLPSLAGLRVLVIDDQKEARESIAALLGQVGANVITAGSGREAMKFITQACEEERPQVLLCDISMPEEDGYATLRRIRDWEESCPGAAHMPAVAVTAFAQREDRIRVMAAGFQMYLAKPVAPLELAVVVANVARNAGAAC